jgi:hypothetical protein
MPKRLMCTNFAPDVHRLLARGRELDAVTPRLRRPEDHAERHDHDVRARVLGNDYN